MQVILTFGQRSTLIAEICDQVPARVHVLETLFASWDASDAALASAEQRLLALARRSGVVIPGS